MSAKIQTLILSVEMGLLVALGVPESAQAAVTVDASSTFHRILTACASAKPMNAHALLA
jgi:hypothetical protein